MLWYIDEKKSFKTMKAQKLFIENELRLYKSYKTTLWLTAFLLMICPACISLKISPDTQRSQSVSYNQPASPFTETQSTNADKAWIDLETGSIISYQSICNESIDPDLDTILQKSTAELLDRKILKRTRIEYNSRRAERVLVSGQLDGVKVHLEFVIFKKNSCSYTLNFISLPEHFKKSTDIFNKFIDGFKVQ